MKHPKFIHHKNGRWTVRPTLYGKRKPKTKRKVATLQIVAREKLMRDDPEEWAVLLGMLGFAGKFIAHEVGASMHMVYYYLSKRGIKLSQYRNGRSKLSQALIQHTSTLPVRQSVLLDMGEQKLLMPR